MTLSIAEMLNQNQVQDVTYYVIKPDGTFVSEGMFQFGSTGESTWIKKENKYFFEAANDIEINYKDTVMDFYVNDNKIELIGNC